MFILTEVENDKLGLGEAKLKMLLNQKQTKEIGGENKVAN